jgi:hypothetical protein
VRNTVSLCDKRVNDSESILISLFYKCPRGENHYPKPFLLILLKWGIVVNLIFRKDTSKIKKYRSFWVYVVILFECL